MIDRTDLRSKTLLPAREVQATSTSPVDIVRVMFYIAFE